MSLTGSQMQSVAINWHIYLLTHSPIALGFVGLTRVLPIIAFSLFGGIVADRRDRRRVMFAAQVVMALTAVALSLLTWTGREGLWAIYLLNAVGAGAWAFDNPARQALMPRLVPPSELPAALSLYLTANQVSLVGGPALAGVLIAGSGAGFGGLLPGTDLAQGRAGLSWIYALNAVSFLGVLVTLLSLRTPGTVVQEGAAERPFGALLSGLRFVFSTPIMVWTMAVDFFATFFSGSMSLLPVFADRVLRVGPRGYGWLMAAPAAGALIGSLYTTLRPLPRRQGPVLLWAVAAYGLATVVYGLSRSYVLTLLALAGTGLADVASTIIRQTIRQTITPDGLRGRMTSVNMIFFMGGPQLGEVEAGLVASLFRPLERGVTLSVVSGGLATIVLALAAFSLSSVLRSYDGRGPSPPSPPGPA